MCIRDRIWIVEDDPQIGLLIELTVKKAGHEARRLVDGVELERALQKDAPELLLLDLMLREKDGFTLLREWKQRQRTKDIPAVSYTHLTEAVLQALQAVAARSPRAPFR